VSQVASERAFEEDIGKREMEVEHRLRGGGDMMEEDSAGETEGGDEEADHVGPIGGRRLTIGKRFVKGVKGVKKAARRFTIGNVGKTPSKRPRDRRNSVVRHTPPHLSLLSLPHTSNSFRAHRIAMCHIPIPAHPTPTSWYPRREEAWVRGKTQKWTG
jgi:hypothetical protein